MTKFVRIELRSIEWNKGASEETLCFSAQVWIDGLAMLWAVNHGHGAETLFKPITGVDPAEAREAETRANAFLAKDRKPIKVKGLPDIPFDLELFCFEQVEIDGLYKDFKAQMRRKILLCEDGALYEIKAPPSAQNIAAAKERHRKAVILNGLPNEFVLQAATQLYRKAA